MKVGDVKVGDLVRARRTRKQWQHGIIVEIHRQLQPEFSDRINSISVLKDDGEIGKWYPSHVELIK